MTWTNTVVENDVHTVPATWSDEQPHELDRDCWCQPEIVESDDALTQVIHRDKLDRDGPEDPA